TTGSAMSVSCDDDTLPFGYPISHKNAFDALTRKAGAGSSEKEQDYYRVARDLESHVKALRGALDPAQVKELAKLARENISNREDVTLANCLDDLEQFVSEPNVSEDARTTYANLRLDVLHRTHWPDSPVDPGISVEDSDEAVEAEIDAAE